MINMAEAKSVKIKKRRYQPIWEAAVSRAIEGNIHPVEVRIPGLTDAQFRRVRKAFWKERDLDQENKKSWRCCVIRVLDQTDLIHFSAVPPLLLWKDRI